MMPAKDETTVWFEKAKRLEQDRDLLLAAWQALRRVELGLNGTGKGLVETPIYRAMMRLLGHALDRLNARQEEYIDRMAGFISSGGDVGRKGGLAGDVVFLKRLGSHDPRVGRKAMPLIDSVLIADVKRAAERLGVSPRLWIEGALRVQLASAANKRSASLPQRIRGYLREQPATAAAVAQALGEPQAKVGKALRDLARGSRHGGRPLVEFTGTRGSRKAQWVSLEEE